MPRPLSIPIFAILSLTASTALAQTTTTTVTRGNVTIISTTSTMTRVTRPGVLNATPAQAAAITEIQKTLEPFSDALATARDELALASFTLRPTDSALRTATQKVANADLALANARQRAFTELQQSPNRLEPAQIPSFVALLTNPPITAVVLGAWGVRTPAPLLPRATGK